MNWLCGRFQYTSTRLLAGAEVVMELREGDRQRPINGLFRIALGVIMEKLFHVRRPATIHTALQAFPILRPLHKRGRKRFDFTRRPVGNPRRAPAFSFPKRHLVLET